MLSQPPNASPRSSLVVAPGRGVDLTAAASLGATEVVIDLEDGVPPAEKESARAAAAAAVRSWAGPADLAVRINEPGSPWCHLDLIAVAESSVRPRSVVVPKISCPGDIAFVDRFLDGIEGAAGHLDPLRVQVMIETPAALAGAQEIATCSERIESLVIGYHDLGSALGGDRDLDAWGPTRQAVAVASRAAGIAAIDGPHLGVAVDWEFRASVARAREEGFDGKWLLAADQISTFDEFFRGPISGSGVC